MRVFLEAHIQSQEYVSLGKECWIIPIPSQTRIIIELHQQLEDRLVQLGSEIPGPMTGFARLHKKAVSDGALSRKVQEMMTLAISSAVGCKGCIAYHVHDSVKAGATRPELNIAFHAYEIAISNVEDCDGTEKKISEYPPLSDSQYAGNLTSIEKSLS